MSFPRLGLRAAALVFAVSTLACNEPTGTTRDQLSGSYVASLPATGGSAFGSLTFTTTEGGVTVDRVAEGAEIKLVLAADGTTSGSLFVPNADPEAPGESFTADLTGTWSVAGNVITLTHGADTFLRDMPLTVKGDRLEGDRTFGNVRVRLSLVRQ